MEKKRAKKSVKAKSAEVNSPTRNSPSVRSRDVEQRPAEAGSASADFSSDEAQLKISRSLDRGSLKSEKLVKDEENKVKRRSGGFKIMVKTINGEDTEELLLPKELFAAKRNRNLEAQAVRVYLANQREGAAATKTRGEVSGSTRKLFRQKGTGRARHGGVRAPIFVGGGIVFGPKPRDYRLTMPQKMRRLAIASSLTGKLMAGEVRVVADLNKIEGKTKQMAQALDNLNANGSVLLVITSQMEKVKLAGRNLPQVTISNLNSLNTYEVAKNKTLVFAKEALCD